MSGKSDYAVPRGNDDGSAAEKEPEVTDASVRELADTVPHQMWISRPEGGIVFLNRRFSEYTGIPTEGGRGLGWGTVIHPDDLAECLSTRDEAIQQGKPWRFDYRLRRHDGVYRWHTGRTLPIRDEATGVITKWVGTATDINDEVEAAQRQRRFLREVLSSVTDGRLQLFDSESELPPPPDGDFPEPMVLSRESLFMFRRRVIAACEAAGLKGDRATDLLIGAGEAALNAVVHGGGNREGNIYVSRDRGGFVQVRVTDKGDGIAQDSIHRATLESGFSSAGTLGQGFPLILRSVDYLFLHTSEAGTTVVLEQNHIAPLPEWMRDYRK